MYIMTNFNYELLYYPKEHFITIRQTAARKLYFGNNQVYKLLKNQDPSWDVFITKYGQDQIITKIVLDFDSEDDPNKAKKDAQKLKRFTEDHGLNTVIVKSGSKGYHTYTQTAPWGFTRENDEFNKIHFQKFVENIIGMPELTYDTLDLTNTGAGLHGNIRLIGSIHPKTQKHCEIVEGRFKDWDTEINKITQFENDCYWSAYKSAGLNLKRVEHKQAEIINQAKTKYGVDPCAANDLRTLMPSIYGGDVKTFSDYITMTCPFHDDHTPSLKVKKEFYYCYTCNETGNWWTLRDKGVVDFKEETIRVKK